MYHFVQQQRQHLTYLTMKIFASPVDQIRIFCHVVIIKKINSKVTCLSHQNNSERFLKAPINVSQLQESSNNL